LYKVLGAKINANTETHPLRQAHSNVIVAKGSQMVKDQVSPFVGSKLPGAVITHIPYCRRNWRCSKGSRWNVGIWGRLAWEVQVEIESGGRKRRQ